MQRINRSQQRQALIKLIGLGCSVAGAQLPRFLFVLSFPGTMNRIFPWSVGGGIARFVCKLCASDKNNQPLALMQTADFQLVGVTGFEPVTPCSQSRCANRTALHPELVSAGRFSRDTSLRFAVRAPEGNSPIPECKDNGFFPKSQFLPRKWPAIRREDCPP